jgi:hypothetical protein
MILTNFVDQSQSQEANKSSTSLEFPTPCVESEGSLLHLQVPVTRPYLEPDQFSLRFKLWLLPIPSLFTKIAEVTGTFIFSVLIRKLRLR